MQEIRNDYVNHELYMLRFWNKRLFKQAPINSVFIVYENKLSRNNCLETFNRAERDKPILKRIAHFFCMVFGMEFNKFDYGKHKDSDLHNKIFFKKYVPFHVRPAPKPEMILWQNLDFVNKPVDFVDKVKIKCSIFGTVLLFIAIMIGLPVLQWVVLN